MRQHHSAPKPQHLAQTKQLVLSLALLTAPLLTNAAPVAPTSNGLDANWTTVAGIDGINVHRGDGSYVQSLSASATSWTASDAGDYYFVSVIGDDWQLWERSVAVVLGEETSGGAMSVELLANDAQLFWLPVSTDWRDANGNTLNGINVHSASNGQYLGSISATEVSWTPPSQGDYFLVLVTDSDWSDWPRTNTVSFSGESGSFKQPMLRADEGQLIWDSFASNPAVRAINVHREDGTYLTTLSSDATIYIPEAFGDYYIVTVIGDDWQNWIRSNTVTIGDSLTDAIVDASSYQDILSVTLSYMRGEYYEPYMQVVSDTMRLWQPVLPSVTSSFDTLATWDEFSSEDDDRTCDSGSVVRVVTDITSPGLGSVPALSVTYVYNDCVFDVRTINGSIMISMQGDSPSRLGGQTHRERIEWSGVTIAEVADITTLTGSYSHVDGYSGPYRSFTEEYVTEQFDYTFIEQFSDELDYIVQVNDTTYTVASTSSYFSEDAAVSFTESGQMTIGDSEISAQMSMTDLSYAGDVQMPDGRVSLSIGENIAGGRISVVFNDGSSIDVSKDDASERTVQYAISDGIQTTNIIDAWLYPVRCEDVALGVFSDFSACP